MLITTSNIFNSSSTYNINDNDNNSNNSTTQSPSIDKSSSVKILSVLMIIIMIIIITKTIISLTLIIMLIIMTITIITTIIIIMFLINVLQLKLNILITSIKLIKLKILLMILMLLLDVNNLIIIIIIIMKSIVATKTALSIKIMSPRHRYRKTVKEKSKETAFILGDSMVKKLNGFLLARKLNHKCLVKVRPFSLVKVRCMHDHVKTTVINFNPDHIILHCGTNDLNSEQTASQIARSIIELAVSLKYKDNKISISIIVPVK